MGGRHHIAMPAETVHDGGKIPEALSRQDRGQIRCPPLLINNALVTSSGNSNFTFCVFLLANSIVKAYAESTGDI
jgi:hypothetical protein